MLQGIIRESSGKKSAKALRRDGYLVANVYGKGLENINAAFKMNEYIRTVKNKDTLAFPINLDGKELQVVVQSYESHAVTGNLIHVDLMVAQDNVESHYHVPVKTVGIPIGIKSKGLLNIAKKRLRVKGEIKNVPNSITLNVEPLELGDSILIRDLDKIENITFTDADRESVLSIIKAK